MRYLTAKDIATELGVSRSRAYEVDAAMGIIQELAVQDYVLPELRAEATAWLAKCNGIQSGVIRESDEVLALRKERDHLRKVVEWAKVEVCEVCRLPQPPDAGDGTGGVDAGHLGRDKRGRLVHAACAHPEGP